MSSAEKFSTTGRNGKLTNYQAQLKSKGNYTKVLGQTEKRTPTENANRTRIRNEGDRIDELFGFKRLTEGLPRIGWLLNYMPITMPDSGGIERSGMDLYFLDKHGENFKASLFYAPYFFLDVSDSNRLVEITNFLMRKFENAIVSLEEKDDLDMPNHLAGLRHKLIKMSFHTVQDLVEVKTKLKPIIDANRKTLNSSSEAFDSAYDANALATTHSTVGQMLSISTATNTTSNTSDPLSCLIDMREYDVSYTMRVSIDLDIRVGAWYLVTPEYGQSTCKIEWQKEMLELCEPRVLAFDIECEKPPLKFPNAENDRIFMISYMVSGQGYLIINREIVSEDVDDFEYTPKPHFPGPFHVMNVQNEQELLKKFISHIQELRPHIIVTYNGDRFDWPYVEVRCSKFPDLSLYHSLGIRSSNLGSQGQSQSILSNTDTEYTGRCIVHLDAFCWVQRDSYLPQGNQGLKAVTKHKLGYDPVEVDPEDMVRFAKENPHHMASYSVSDAVATYYLYNMYVHNFIFSLSTIIPLNGEDVLRKGSGTLCEALLMVEAYQGNILCPNKQMDPKESFHKGHLLDSETYIGGHVECLEAGVFRADIPVKFELVPTAFQQLIDRIDRDLTFTIEIEHGLQKTDVSNYDVVKQQIVEQLELLRDRPIRSELPCIYHLDVGAMYPNIILTNRLQPMAMKSLHDCAGCKYNSAINDCKRPMSWLWRGEYSPATQTEYQWIKRQLMNEKFPVATKTTTAAGHTIQSTNNTTWRSFNELPEKEQEKIIEQRLKSYTSKVYRKNKVTTIESRVSTVCMRENSFYVDTVKAFRDRRYDYKLLTKTWKNKKVDAEKRGNMIEKKQCEDREILMDSLQLAHKCILNSFYGYVMRKGARWKSMEMAGIVTHTGAQLIKQARELVEQVGRPLELDTDGIWCILPSSFPQEFSLQCYNGEKIHVEYPCAMLNADVHERYTNHQYQVLHSNAVPIGTETSVHRKYLMHSECSIFFELDGPYKAMVLPASPEEGKLLKKKYVVFNFNNTVAELKGFELKRRGELELVKIFQSQVFEQFLAGATLEDCYTAVGNIANQWLDVLDNRGCDMNNEELLELISERKTISKTIEDYEGRKSTSLTTANRLVDFLGLEMVKDKGLNCHLIISKYPLGAPVTERAIPVGIFSCEPAMTRYFLKKWCQESNVDYDDFRNIIDWEYYKERLGKTIQKIITIPAGMQRVLNPVPRVEHPIWLQKQMINVCRDASKPFQTNKKQVGLKDAFLSMQISANNVSLPGLFSTPNNTTHLTVQIHSTSNSNNGKKRERFDDNIETINLEEHCENISEEKVDEGLAETKDEEIIPMCQQKPSSSEELNSWLTLRKQQWKSLRKSKGAAGKRGEGNALPLGKKPTGVMDFVRQANYLAMNNTWQIIELQASDGHSGDFTAWIMTSQSSLQRLTVTIPRVLYVNILPHSTNGKYSKRYQEEVSNMMSKLNGMKIKKILPHSKEGFELYEVSLSERAYQRYSNLQSLFQFQYASSASDSEYSVEIEGVYETQLPLWFRALLKMGALSKVHSTHSANDSIATGKYSLSDLEMVTTSSSHLSTVANQSYLHPNQAIFKRVYVYFVCQKSSNQRSGNIGALGIFFVTSTNKEEAELLQQFLNRVVENRDTLENESLPVSGKAFVWIISGRNSSSNNQQGMFDSKPPMHRIYRKYQQNEIGDIKFTTYSVNSVEEALELGNEKIEAYYRGHNGPTIFVVQGNISSREHSITATSEVKTTTKQNSKTFNVNSQSTSNSAYIVDLRSWRQSLPALYNFPVSIIPLNNLDELFPAVGWQFYIAERMIQRFLLFPKWFEDRLHCARYANIPIGNLQYDAITTMIDTLYGRQLVNQRHILWASEQGYPDLGQGVSGGWAAESDLWTIWSDRLQEPVINEAGVYRHVCVELDIYGLAICAIMSSAELDADGLLAASRVSTAANGGSNLFGNLEQDNEDAMATLGVVQSSVAFSDSSCGRAFNIFKAFITKCVEEIRLHKDRLADSLLTSSYRYLCGYGNGMLSDPLLHRVVYTLMMKLFWKLVGHLRSLGVKIVHANYHRMIIATNYHQVGMAKEYVDFILQAIRVKDTYSLLEISVKGYWEELIWLESENWAGLKPEEAAPEVVEIAVDNDTAENDPPKEYENEQIDKFVKPQQSKLSKSSKRRKKKKSVQIAAPLKLDDEESDNGDDQEDYDFLGEEASDIENEFDISRIKKQVNSLSGRGNWQERYKDYYRGGYDEDEDFDDENGSVNAEESEHQSHKNKSDRYNSISDLLDTFEGEGEQNRLENTEEYIVNGDRNEENVDDVEDFSHPRIVQHWTLLSHLPAAALIHFRYVIEEFILQYYDTERAFRHEQLLITNSIDPSTAEIDLDSEAFNALSTMDIDEESIQQQSIQQTGHWIETNLTNKLLTIIDELQIAYSLHSTHHTNQSLDAERIDITTTTKAKSMALEFVKASTHILLLDSSLRSFVTALRRLLLAQLQIPEFSLESQFITMAPSYVLRDVICSYCSVCRDVDLLRDASVIHENDQMRWRCIYCANALNTEEVENRLLGEVDILYSSFLLQDFRCQKTQQLQTRLASAFSQLCEPLIMDHPTQKLNEQLQLLLLVAKKHSFSYLESAIQEILLQ